MNITKSPSQMHTVIFLVLITILTGFSAFAGGGSTGGGDICEDRISEEIVTDLSKWLDDGGAQLLDLKEVKLSPEKFAKKLKKEIKLTHFSCVGPNDPGYPIEVDDAVKTCRFDIIKNKHTSTCDYYKFMHLSAYDQYRLVTHELLGLALIESPDRDRSHYKTSNQVPHFYSAEKKSLGLKRDPDSDNRMCVQTLNNLTNITLSYTAMVNNCKNNPEDSLAHKQAEKLAKNIEEFYPEIYSVCQQTCAADQISLDLCEVDISGACPKK